MALLKNALTSKCYFLRNTHRTEQTSFTRVFPSGIHFTAESTEAMQIKRLAQGNSISMLPGFQPAIAVSRNRHFTNITSMIQNNEKMSRTIVNGIN